MPTAKAGRVAGNSNGGYRRLDAVLAADAGIAGRVGARSTRRWWQRKSRRKTVEMAWRAVSRLWSSTLPRILAVLLTCLVLYAAHGKHRQEEGQVRQDPLGSFRHRVRGVPSITIFTALSPVLSPHSIVARREELAVRSWLALSPNISVVIFGQHPSVYEFAADLGPRVSVESAIDFTFLGSPFFHTMVARTQASHSDVSVLIDPGIILLPDFITTLHNAMHLDHDWLLVAIARSVLNFSFHLGSPGQWWQLEVGGRIKLLKRQQVLAQNLHLNGCSGRVLLAWNKGNSPLHSGVLPPFIYGKGFHSQWLINEALSSELRLVIDASEAFMSLYPETFNHYPFLDDSVNNDHSEEVWESNGNSNLAATYGSIYFRKGNFSSLVKLVCSSGKYFYISAAGNMIYSSDSLHGQRIGHFNPAPAEVREEPLMTRKFSQTMSMQRLTNCAGYNRPYREECSLNEFLKVNFASSSPLSLPFSLESLLKMTADDHKTIVLAVAGDSYRDMLMSWVCRLRHLSVKNFIIGALDSDIYHFSVIQGLPVFRDILAPDKISINNCHFGSECFQRVTKVKSRLVLQILKLDYNVLLSDVDVYWFHNPLPHLYSFGPAILLAQSDEYNETGPINLPRRLNSGFYFARSDVSTIAAMGKVVKHASVSELSEQPSFYDVLCGEGGINRIGNDQCLEPESNLTIHLLDRNLFPNGAFKGLWEKHDVSAACKQNGCLILHNNWISGRKRKLERQVISGLWAYNASSRMCVHR